MNQETSLPYVSVNVFVRFLDLINDKHLSEPITSKFLLANGFSFSNSYMLFASLKSLGLIDNEGRMSRREDLVALTSTDNKIKQPVLQRIIEKTYSDLLENIKIEDATIEKVKAYYLRHQIAISVATKAARFFLWIANEAGYKTSDEFVPYKLDGKYATKDSRNFGDDRLAQNKLVIRESFKYSSKIKSMAADEYENIFLNILLNKIISSNELPTADLLNCIRDLIERKRQKENV